MFNQIDYVYTNHYIPMSERNINLKTLQWLLHLAPQRGRTITDALNVFLKTPTIPHNLLVMQGPRIIIVGNLLLIFYQWQVVVHWVWCKYTIEPIVIETIMRHAIGPSLGNNNNMILLKLIKLYRNYFELTLHYLT